MKKIFLLVAGLCVLSIRAPAYSSSSTPPPAAARQSASPPRTSKPGGPPKPDAAAKAVPPGKSPPAPADWDTYTDAERGYRFKVPKGTRTDSRAVAGFDRLIASVPDPQRVAVLVVAFRESRFSKEELLEAAKRTLEKLGENNIKVDLRTKLSDDFELVEITSTAGNGLVTKLKALLATNATDNYVMLLGSPEPSFKADEQTIDIIWGSFVMLGTTNRAPTQF
jgi:hypothetical protein